MKKIVFVLILAAAALAFTPDASASVCNLCSDPDASSLNVAGSQSAKAKKKTATVTFKTSIRCHNCVKKITENISFEKGVKDLSVSLDEKLVTITYDPSRTDEATLAKALEKLGYTVEKVKR